MKKVDKNFVWGMFQGAKSSDLVEHYFKCQQVDARPAVEGEEIVTVVRGERETKNTAKKGDMVIRAKTKSKEEYIIGGDKFTKRYKLEKGSEADDDGFKTFDPIGDCYAFEYENGESFKFDAPWGEEMIMHAGDFLASTSLNNPDDIYRIARDEFLETYKKEKS